MLSPMLVKMLKTMTHFYISKYDSSMKECLQYYM